VLGALVGVPAHVDRHPASHVQSQPGGSGSTFLIELRDDPGIVVCDVENEGRLGAKQLHRRGRFRVRDGVRRKLGRNDRQLLGHDVPSAALRHQPAGGPTQRSPQLA
jgi:hypothetical protein